MRHVLRFAMLTAVFWCAREALAQQPGGPFTTYSRPTPTRDSVMPPDSTTPGAPQPSDYQSAADQSIGETFVSQGTSQEQVTNSPRGYLYANGRWWYNQNDRWLVWQNDRWQESANPVSMTSYGAATTADRQPTPMRDAIMPSDSATPGAPQPSDYHSAADQSIGTGSPSGYLYTNGQWFYRQNDRSLVWQDNRWQEQPMSQQRTAYVPASPSRTSDLFMPPDTATPGAPQPSDSQYPFGGAF